MRPYRFLAVLGAVTLGIAGGLVLDGLDLGASGPDKGTPTEHRVVALSLGEPRPLIRPEDVEGERVTRTEAKGQTLLVGTVTGAVYRLGFPSGDAEAATLPAEPAVALSQRVSDLALSDDGTVYVAMSLEDFVVVRGMNELRPRPFKAEFAQVAVSADGRVLAVAAFGVTTWDLQTSTVIDHEQPLPDGGRDMYADVAVSSTESLAAVDTVGVDVWQGSSQKTDGPTRVCGCEPRGIDLSANGKRAAFGSASGHLVIMDVDTGELLADKTVSVDDYAWAVALNSDGTLAVAVTPSSEALILDVERNQVAWHGRVPLKGVGRVYFAPGDNALVLETSRGSNFVTQAWRVPLVSRAP